MGWKKLDKKFMVGFLVGYQAGNIYRIYHPMMKEIKVSRNVIFLENQFFDGQPVEKESQGLEFEGTNARVNEMDRDIQLGESHETPIVHDQTTV